MCIILSTPTNKTMKSPSTVPAASTLSSTYTGTTQHLHPMLNSAWKVFTSKCEPNLTIWYPRKSACPPPLDCTNLWLENCSATYGNWSLTSTLRWRKTNCQIHCGHLPLLLRNRHVHQNRTQQNFIPAIKNNTRNNEECNTMMDYLANYPDGTLLLYTSDMVLTL